MIRKIGIISILLLGSVTAVLLNKNRFVDNFLNNQCIEIMGTILALNIATASFLIGNLIKIEMDFEKRIFDKSIVQIKHNIYFMFAAFFLELTFLVIRTNLVVDIICVAIFLSYGFCLYEMTAAVFITRKNFRIKNDI